MLPKPFDCDNALDERLHEIDEKYRENLRRLVNNVKISTIKNKKLLEKVEMSKTDKEKLMKELKENEKQQVEGLIEGFSRLSRKFQYKQKLRKQPKLSTSFTKRCRARSNAKYSYTGRVMARPSLSNVIQEPKVQQAINKAIEIAHHESLLQDQMEKHLQLEPSCRTVCDNNSSRMVPRMNLISECKDFSNRQVDFFFKSIQSLKVLSSESTNFFNSRK
jgi:hypothetical protein